MCVRCLINEWELTAKFDVFHLWALLPMKLGFSRGAPLEVQHCAGRLIGTSALPGGPALIESLGEGPPPKPKTSHLAVNGICWFYELRGPISIGGRAGCDNSDGWAHSSVKWCGCNCISFQSCVSWGWCIEGSHRGVNPS